jgi:hypothetical protein
MSTRFEMRTDCCDAMQKDAIDDWQPGPEIRPSRSPDKISSMGNHAVRKLRVFGFACCFKYFVARNVSFSLRVAIY